MITGRPTLGVYKGLNSVNPFNTPNYNLNLQSNKIEPPEFSQKTLNLNRRTIPQALLIRTVKGNWSIQNTPYTVNDRYSYILELSPQYEL